jgi:hypothetical protein
MLFATSVNGTAAIMANRFRDPVLKKEYDAVMQMFLTKHQNLFSKDGSRSRGNGVANSFWLGYDGKFFGIGWDSNSKQTLMYAHWRAGQDAKKAETTKGK